MSLIHNVLVVGASGNVGRSTVRALLDEGYKVTGLTRESSTTSLPAEVDHVKSDFSLESLTNVFKGQDAVISTISSVTPGTALASQTLLVDAAIAAQVKVFCPSEFGIDTADPSASTYIPFLIDKIDTVSYLKKHQDKISWTAVITGCMFDWGLRIPGFGGWDISKRSATIFDGGDIPFEATNLDQVGRALAKCLKNPGLTANHYVYVNSFTVTQNEVLKALERATGEKFNVTNGTVNELWQDGANQVKEGQGLGVLKMIAGAIYGKGNLANFSKSRGLWNEKLGLPQEDLDVSIQTFLSN